MPTTDPILQVADLVDRPGASRRVDLALPAPPGLDLPLTEIVRPLRLRGVLESVVEGLLVRGTLEVDLRLACARCLEPVDASVSTDIAELFSEPGRTDGAVDPDDLEEGYEVRDGQIDLDTLLRDALVPAVPLQPLCDAACKGICPTCGTNRNAADCACVDAPGDPRWSALADLRLPNQR